MRAYAFNENKPGSILRHGRGFLNFKTWQWGAEWSFLRRGFCHAYLTLDRDGDYVVSASVALPWLAAFWLHVQVPYGHWLHRAVCAIVPKDYSGGREIGVRIHDWTIWLNFWTKTMEHVTKDPWYIRGITINLPDLVLGRADYHCLTVGQPIPLGVGLDDRLYRGTISPQVQTWKRPRWFTKRRHSANVTMQDPIPIPGKGENSYDCGEDALCGTGSNSCDPSVVAAELIESVCRTRLKYGGPNWKPDAVISRSS